jgi:uncharacterized membrane protein
MTTANLPTASSTATPNRGFKIDMTSTPFRLGVLLIVAIIYGVVASMILRAYPALYQGLGFNLDPILKASTAIKIHVAAALVAFTLGLAMFALPKGKGLHKPMGWVWVVLMVTTALSSFFITGLMGDSYSPIHMLSGWTLIALPLALLAARRRQIANHRKGMEGLFMGGIFIAGLFTFLPGRLLWNVFFGG